MKLKSIFLLPLFVVLLTLPLFVHSATLQLTRIGSLDLGGHTYSEWWYSGVNPTFTGKAAVDADVTIKVNDTSNTTKSNSSGDWSYAATLSAGDYSVVISQGSESYAFQLHLGQSLPDTAGSSTQSTSTGGTVPETGFNQMVALTFGIGIALLASYFYVSADLNKKPAFEKRIIREE